MGTDVGPGVSDYRSPALDLPGACPAPEGSPDAGVPWHYGDPHAEQRRLAAGRGSVDLSHRGVIAVTGPDRLTWLHSLTTQHLEALAPGMSTTALVLSPHGHVEHELHIADDGTTTWITVEPDISGSTVRYSETGLPGSYTLDESPKATNVTPGLTVYYQVTNDNYYPVTGSETVVITPREIKLTTASETRAYNGDPLMNPNWAYDAGSDEFVSGQGFATAVANGTITNVGVEEKETSGGWVTAL